MAGMSDPSSMSEQVKHLISAFDRLTESDQRVFAAAVLRRTRDLSWPPLDDETIDRIADESSLNMTFARRPMSRADRGEVWIIDLGYVAKTRPCLDAVAFRFLIAIVHLITSTSLVRTVAGPLTR